MLPVKAVRELTLILQTENAGLGKRNALSVAKLGVTEALADSKPFSLEPPTVLELTCRSCCCHRRFCWTNAFQFHWNVSSNTVTQISFFRRFTTLCQA
jgi:hypothetical protein